MRSPRGEDAVDPASRSRAGQPRDADRRAVPALPAETRDASLMPRPRPIRRSALLADAGVVDPEASFGPPRPTASWRSSRRDPVRPPAARSGRARRARGRGDSARSTSAWRRSRRPRTCGPPPRAGDAGARRSSCGGARAGCGARESRGASLDAVALYERASLLTPRPENAVARGILAAEGAYIDLADLHYADAILDAGARSAP